VQDTLDQIIEATRELLVDTVDSIRRQEPVRQPDPGTSAPSQSSVFARHEEIRSSTSFDVGVVCQI